MSIIVGGTKCWRWYNYYNAGLILSACGGVSMVLALPAIILNLYYGHLDIIWLIFIIACIICAGEILIRYGMYRKRYEAWVEMLMFLLHNKKEDSNE